jgi:hypothetical protein
VIAAARTRRRRWMTLMWVILSAVLHVTVITLILAALPAEVQNPRGESLRLSDRMTVSIQKQVAPPKPVPKRVIPHELAAAPAPRAAARHELARQAYDAPPQPPQRPHAVAVSPIQRDREAFADEVAALNKSNDPHAIPTIDPASRGTQSRSYRFDTSLSDSGEQHGNGIISPTQSWQERGLDCYYTRYSYTYPSGAMEDGSIVWPVCYNPASDPFHQPPHPMPFPLPVAGYTLPPGTQLPPLEKSVYEQWAAGNGN